MRLIVPELLPLLEDADSMHRAAILGAVLHRIGSDNVTAAQLRPLSTAAHDDMPQVRLRVAICLAEAGRCASNERLTILKLCADTNPSVRVAAVWALERVGGESDDGTALETALAQWAESEGGPLMGWEVYVENLELRMNGLADAIVVACLTNANPRVRRNAVLALERHFHAAKPAYPVITNLLDDPDALVRKHARALVESISGSGPER
jgi:HEAT repeat protein